MENLIIDPRRNVHIKTYFNSVPYSGKVFTQPSLTVPDQTLSIREILDRYARGLPLEVRTPIWDDNADENDVMPDPRTLDLAERQQMAIDASNELEHLKLKMKEKYGKEKQKQLLKSENKPIVEPPPTPQPPPSEN